MLLKKVQTCICSNSVHLNHQNHKIILDSQKDQAFIPGIQQSKVESTRLSPGEIYSSEEKTD